MKENYKDYIHNVYLDFTVVPPTAKARKSVRDVTEIGTIIA